MKISKKSTIIQSIKIQSIKIKIKRECPEMEPGERERRGPG
jgi:hypothetical protein